MAKARKPRKSKTSRRRPPTQRIRPPHVVKEDVFGDVTAVEFASGANGDPVIEAIRRNKVPILVQADSILLHLGDRLTTLRRERRNAFETQAAVAETIARLESLGHQLTALREATVALRGKESEAIAKAAATSFVQGNRNWWNEDHVNIVK